MAEINSRTIGKLMDVVNAKQSQGHKQFTILLHSPGGDVGAAVTGYNFLNGFQDLEIITHNVGLVASAAVALYCAGHIRTCAPNAIFKFEDIRGGALTGITKDYDLNERLKLLTVSRLECAKMVAYKVNRTENQIIQLLMRQGSLMQADEAIIFHLAHRKEEKIMKAEDVIVTISV